ncbi:hypothetical protein G7Y89_g10540 [Cudoniella acicularis]|uniref:Nephrocystin 3-like N-terminal domain-containing protein n=1 Tax=Cudoniella acicularis TaxID=354080 RepID=A0A8H4REW3_9HELO|nr:hypothetical protein G7Y89_g10540 [Cudoniella acicularis]
MESENLQTFQEPSAIGLSVLVNPSRPSLDIVFVHGFTGHPERTWSQKRGASDGQFENDEDGERPSKFRKLLGNRIRRSIYWPRDLLPINIPNARILTYGYDTNIRHRASSAINKSTVYDIAWNFLVSLEAARCAETSRPLLFIAHSLGGIIVKEALRRSRGCETHQSHLHSIYEFSSGIVFFGTPHSGADPRGLVLHIFEQVIRGMGFNVNDQIVNALLPSAERLKELRDEFGPMARQRNWTIYSFQEQYGVMALGGKKVVDDTASCLNDPTIEVTQHIASNHMEMCRFSGPNDIEYAKVVGAINRILENTTRLNPSSERIALNADQRQYLLDCLRFDQIDARHATIKTAHAKTCKWLLSNSEYQEWLNQNKIPDHYGFLWIKGKPATGKSTIMKFAYANAKKTMRDTITLSFFFNARGEQLEKSALGMYRSLLFQLLKMLPDLLVTFESLPSSLPSNFNQWNIEAVKNIFGRAIESLGQRHLICFIDALDECEEDEVREMVTFFERLGQFATASQIQLHVCFSSRHYPHITIEKGVSLVLEDQGGHEQDIANYLHSELKAGRSKLVDQIKDEILQRASGIFLWVVLVVQMLNKEFNCGRIYALRKRLDEIPNGLDELFQDILSRDGQNMEELILCLQWILYAKRPLKREEFYFAVLSGVAPEALAAWSLEEITRQDMERFILSSSKGLAETTKSNHQTVQFIHESVRDFLLKGNGLNKLQLNLSSNFPGFSHERLKHCCQAYLRIDLSECLTPGISLPVASSQEAKDLRQLSAEKFPFLEYATHNVLYHADSASGYGTSQTAFMEHFCLQDWISLDNLFERYEIRRHTSDSSLLYLLAERNLSNLIQIELQRVQNMDIKGERYGFPLNVALVHKNESAIRVLLIPNTIARSNDSIPLNLYSLGGREYQESITSILQNQDDMGSLDDRTLLSWAAGRGHEAVVKLLLETGHVDVESKDKNGQTPLSWAPQGGHEAVVKLLLETRCYFALILTSLYVYAKPRRT